MEEKKKKKIEWAQSPSSTIRFWDNHYVQTCINKNKGRTG